VDFLATNDTHRFEALGGFITTAPATTNVNNPTFLFGFGFHRRACHPVVAMPGRFAEKAETSRFALRTARDLPGGTAPPPAEAQLC
jgi:hypothetical protein